MQSAYEAERNQCPDKARSLTMRLAPPCSRQDVRGRREMPITLHVSFNKKAGAMKLPPEFFSYWLAPLGFVPLEFVPLAPELVPELAEPLTLPLLQPVMNSVCEIEPSLSVSTLLKFVTYV